MSEKKLTKFKVLATDGLSPEGIKVFADAGIIIDVKKKLPKEEILKILKNYDGLIVRSATKVTKELIAEAKNLKIIGRAGEGVDNIDVPSATKQGIIVMNTPGANTISAAEHTLAMLLAMARNIPQATASTRQGLWEREKFTGTELKDKILGVLGLGKIGKEVVKRALAFEMKVLVYDPFVSEEYAKSTGVELKPLKEILKQCDFLTLHLPKNDKTLNLITKKEIAIMKPSAKIINCARGGIINEKDLFTALEEKLIAGCAIDVYEKEPTPADNPLLKHPNAICTPHLGASTIEAQEKVGVQIAHQVANALLDKGILNAVNMPAATAEEMEKIKPYLTLCEKLGKILASFMKSAPEKINVEYCGDIAQQKISALTVASIKGYLDYILDEPVNFVNALLIAKNRGINISESKNLQIENYNNLISLEAEGKNIKTKLSGTIFGKKETRIVKINDVYVDIIPKGHLVFIDNLDVPGVIGKIGTILGENGINISAFENTQSKSGRALSIFNVDSQLPEKVLKQIENIKEIKEVWWVKV